MKRILAVLAALLCTAAAPAADPVDLKALLSDKPAATLGAYHLFTDASATHPNAGVTPFALNTPLFTDYAAKHRYVFLPPGAKARYRAEGALDLPVGATLIKTFAYPADFRRPDEKVRVIETRLLIHRRSGWAAIAYVWNADGTEAVLKRAGAHIDVAFTDVHGQARQIDYRVPNQNQCKECHSLSGRVAPIGPKARNLNGDYAYADGTENQLAHWTRTGMLTGAPDPKAIPRTAVWDNPAEPLEARARAYLDGNCGHCHNPRGIASNTGLWLELEQQRPARLGVGKRPAAAGKGAGDLEVDLVPGHPDASIITYRMASTEAGVMMPELGRSLVHDEGLALVRDYIASLKAK
jgi:uncharacterized repeat protein (TIGR03806 family)